jgi:mRNA interferase HigB
LENRWYNGAVRILGANVVIDYFAAHASDQRINAAMPSYRAWEAITLVASWNAPQDVKLSHPKASILKSSRVVFNIKGNDYRLVCVVNYQAKLVIIRWFGAHPEYDKIDADSV